MARPKKTGLSYFPKDVDFWDDFKIMDLLNEYGPLGTAVYDIVISRVYQNGYYLEVSLESLAAHIVRIIGNRWVSDKKLIVEIILYCAEIGLLDKELIKQSVITSVGIQRRYDEVTVRNKADKSRYRLIGTDSSACDSEAQQEDDDAKTVENVSETQVNETFIPQKKSKEKKSKSDERKQNQTKAKSSSAAAEEPVCEYQKIINSFNDVCIDLPKVLSLTDKRKARIRNAVRTIGGDLTGFFRLVEDSDFLTGRSGQWRADFDWITEPSNIIKILEGNYSRRKPPASQHENPYFIPASLDLDEYESHNAVES